MVIYKTTNLTNGKIYIGKDSKNNKNYIGGGKLLKLAIKKYGKKNFIKEILETCKTIDELNKKEIYWIEKLKSRETNIGYNILVGGEISPMENNKHTDETKIKMSLNHIDVSGDKNPMFGKTCEDAWKEQGLTKKEIEKKKNDWLVKRSDLSKGKNNGMYGVSRVGNDNPFFGKKHNEETKKTISAKANKKIVLQFDLDSKLLKEWESTMIVYRELGINCRNCCRGLTKTACGFIWKYKN
jgi:group I intron endonuclease